LSNVAESVVFEPHPVDPDGSAEEFLATVRANCLGSLYYFTKYALRRQRLNGTLHRQICRFLERPHIKDVLELPRDHFKSTICSEAWPMWLMLPFGQRDEDILRSWGYGDEFIRWMKWAHNPLRRILIISENITNAAKLGRRIAWHFESNQLYRALFPETLPTPSEVWNSFSLHIRRPAGAIAAHGEGAFDFLGVMGALQSRHYDVVIEDDLVGRKAIESPSVMEKTIEYHRLIVGAFENEDRNHEAPELVVGNRWGYHDLNSWIRENEPWFQIHSHSALGGCCPDHPADTPIFPEEFSEAKLLRIRERLGSYLFSCQYLNNPVAPDDADFHESWLGFYDIVDGKIVHEPANGVVRRDIPLTRLSIAMASDPNHAGNTGRCRHAIVVVGVSDDGDWYLLDCWAQACGFDKYIDTLYEMAQKWGVRRVGLETIAAQRYLQYHIEFRNRLGGYSLQVIPLKGEVSAPDGGVSRRKEWRIRSVLAPLFEAGKFWTRRRFQEFLAEYVTFPKGKYCDILDSLAYISQLARVPMNPERFYALMAQNHRRSRFVRQPYCMEEWQHVN
jgi:hypothetical protein